MQVLTDVQWSVLSPLIEACRPKGKTPLRHLRRTVEAIIWRHQNGAKWRSVPEELGPWWAAAPTFIRWARLGVWEKLLAKAQERGLALGMTFLDGTNIRAHQKAAGAVRKGALKLNGIDVKHLAALVVAFAQRPASSPMA
jgi:transposase